MPACQIWDFFEQLNQHVDDLCLATDNVIHVRYSQLPENHTKFQPLLTVLTLNNHSRTRQNLINFPSDILSNSPELLHMPAYLQQLNNASRRHLYVLIAFASKLANQQRHQVGTVKNESAVEILRQLYPYPTVEGFSDRVAQYLVRCC